MESRSLVDWRLSCDAINHNTFVVPTSQDWQLNRKTWIQLILRQLPTGFWLRACYPIIFKDPILCVFCNDEVDCISHYSYCRIILGHVKAFWVKEFRRWSSAILLSDITDASC